MRARMYFHTKAGYEAMLLLARYHYIEGRPLRRSAMCAASRRVRRRDPVRTRGFDRPRFRVVERGLS